MSSISQKNTIRNSILLVLILSYSYWTFYNAFLYGKSLTYQGDGLATIGFVAHIMNAFQEKGFAIFLNDYIQIGTFAAGYSDPISLNIAWKVLYIGLGVIFAPDNVYDVIAMIAFLATILSGYAVARLFGAHASISIFSGILLANLPNFFFRIEGHLGLACYFVSILQIGFAHSLAKHLDYKNSAIFSLISALAFVQNEYYGYFGIIFCSIYIIAARLMLFSSLLREDLYKIAKTAIISLIIFVLTMALLYPNLIGSKLLFLFINNSEIVTAAPQNYSSENFNAFSTPHPLGILSSTILGLKLLTDHLNDGNPFEFTFRIGLVVPVLIILLLSWLKIYAPQKSWISVRQQILSLIIPMVIMVGLALPLTSSWSLAKLTLTFASLFRVGSRAYIFVDIGMILILALVASEYLRAQSIIRQPTIKLRNSFLLLSALYMSYADLTGSWFPKTIAAATLPPASYDLRVLKNLEEGFLIELPFLTSSSAPEDSYVYSYNYIMHQKPIVNGVYYWLPTQDPELDQLFTQAASRINTPSPNDIIQLGKAGVRYIVITKYAPNVHLTNASLSNLTKLYDGEHYAIYETKSYDNNGDFIGDFVLNSPIRIKWNNCGIAYESKGQHLRLCELPSNIEVQNFTNERYSANYSCKITPTKGSPIQVTYSSGEKAFLSDSGAIIQHIEIPKHAKKNIFTLTSTDKFAGAYITVKDCGMQTRGEP